MSTKTINIDYPSISASTTSPNVLANAYIQNIIASKEYHIAVASDNSTSLLVTAQPAGHPAIPGLYKRVSDVSNIVSIPLILLATGSNVLSTYSTTSEIFNEVDLHKLSNVLALSSAIHSKETSPLFLTETILLEMLSKYTEQTHTTESPIVEEKDAFVSNYFQDLTYAAPTQYVGTLTLI